jgi:hypothetical protein
MVVEAEVAELIAYPNNSSGEAMSGAANVWTLRNQVRGVGGSGKV